MPHWHCISGLIPPIISLVKKLVEMRPACRVLLGRCTLIVMSNWSVAGGGAVPIDTKIILSSHNFESTPTDKALETTLRAMWAAGADVAKIATTANDITDCARVLTLLKTSQGMSRKKKKEKRSLHCQAS